MSGDLAQIVALAAYGNAWLGTDEAPPELYPGHSVFQHVRRLVFAGPRAWCGLGRRGRWTSTAGWYADLRRRGARAFRLEPWPRQHPELPDHIAVAFAGGAPCALGVEYEGGCEWWAAQWRREQLAWSVEYDCGVLAGLAPAAASLEEVGGRLREAIEEAVRFAEKAQQGGWVQWLGEALSLLGSPDPVIPYHPDLLPDRGYSLEARRALACACKAWVFGGMGSWNDLVFADAAQQAEYDRVTPRLFQAVLRCIATAASSGASQDSSGPQR